tara:strand:- start:126 stop:1400 length:1275 start_codon:yes stop_codon:yes gene_type:complete
MSVFNNFSKIKLTKTIPKTIFVKTPGTGRTLSTNGVRNTSYRFQSAEPKSKVNRKEKLEAAELAREAAELAIRKAAELAECEATELAELAAGALVTASTGETKSDPTQEETYPNLRLNSYEFYKPDNCSEYPVIPKDASGAAFIIIEKKVDGNPFIATHVEDRVPLNIKVPLLEWSGGKVSTLTFDGVDLTAILPTIFDNQDFDFLDQYRYNKIGLRERSDFVPLEKRVIKGIAEEIHAKFDDKEDDKTREPPREPDFWLGRKKGKKVRWQPWFIISMDEIVQTEDVKNVMTNAFSSKAFKFNKHVFRAAINAGRLGRKKFANIQEMLAHPAYLGFLEEDDEMIKLKNPYGEVLDGFPPEQNFVSQEEAKEYLKDYLKKVYRTKVQAEQNGDINPLAAGFELSRWGEEGLIDNWLPIMAIINQK